MLQHPRYGSHLTSRALSVFTLRGPVSKSVACGWLHGGDKDDVWLISWLRALGGLLFAEGCKGLHSGWYKWANREGWLCVENYCDCLYV